MAASLPEKAHAQKTPRGTPQPPLVRRGRPQGLRPPRAHRADGLRQERLRRQAGDRHHQHLERHQLLPQPLPAARRGSEARRVAGGRVPGRDARDHARRAVPEALHDDVPQSPRDGNGGIAALLPRRRLRAHGRLRQNDAGARDGCALDGAAGDLHARRPDAARQLARAIPRLGQRRAQVLGGAARGHDQRARLGRHRGRHRALAWPLHDHGNRIDHDLGGGGAGARAARIGLDSGARLQSREDGDRGGQAHRRPGLGRPDPQQASHAILVRQRRHLRPRLRRLDQLDHPPDRHGAARRHRARHRPLRRDLAQGAGDREPAALRASTSWRISTTREACARCSPRSATCSTSKRRP